MLNWLPHKNAPPIGIDIGSRSVKLIQFNNERTKVLEAARWDLPAPKADEPPEERRKAIAEAIRKARDGRKFRGKDAVIGLTSRELFVQNVRVPKMAAAELTKAIQQEASAKLPYPLAEAELRYLEAGDVRQGEALKREVILLACRRNVLTSIINVIVDAGLQPVAVDTEPTAMLRCYTKQFRREEDHTQRAMFVHIGAANTIAVIARGAEVLFVKYIDIGGKHLDDALAAHLQMTPGDAIALRRHNGDRRVDQQDPEVARSIQEALRPSLEKIAQELALCQRYHSVTFRGQPLSRLVLGGGEATASLADFLATRLDVKCELGDPLRLVESALPNQRRGQWDVVTGLALRELPA